MMSTLTLPSILPRRSPLLPVGAILLVALMLSLHQLGARLPLALWWQAVIAPAPTCGNCWCMTAICRASL